MNAGTGHLCWAGGEGCEYGEVWLVGLGGSKQMVYESDAGGPQRWCTGMRLMVFGYAMITVLMLYKITQSHLILLNPT